MRERWSAPKKALKPKDVWAIRFFLEHDGPFVIVPFSISPSTANYAAATRSRSRSATWSMADASASGRQ
jgi:hypothetical protein